MLNQNKYETFSSKKSSNLRPVDKGLVKEDKHWAVLMQ